MLSPSCYSAFAPDPVGPASDELAAAREEYLEAEVQRVRFLHAGASTTSTEELVILRRATLGEAWGAFRTRSRERRGPHGDRVAELATLVAGIATDRRAIVHYNLRAGHLQAFWVLNGGQQRGWLTCEDADLHSIMHAVLPWVEGAHGDVDALITAASPLAVELVDTLAPLGVTEIVLMPWSILQGVPFAALKVENSRLGDRMDISYAPSVAILRIGERAKSTFDHAALVAAHGKTLRWADPEVRAIARLYHTEGTIDGGRDDVVRSRIQSGRVVHIASHGLWWREDHFASVLDVRDGGPIDRYISAAEVCHRDVDASGAEVVVLSACDTGRAPTDKRWIESYTGIDAAFLVRGAKAVASTMWRVPDLAAMLFSVQFHARLVDGDAVAAAFRLGVQAVRSAGDDLDAHAIEVLDAEAPGWREACRQHVASLTAPATWATFRLSGAHWWAQPLRG